MADGRSTLAVLLEEGGLRVAAPGGGEPTFPSGAPDRTLDWILAGEGVLVTEARVHPTEHADHDAVSAVLRRAAAP